MTFTWHIQHDIPSFDFGCAAIIAKTRGYTDVVFTLGDHLHALKYPEEEVWRRVRKMLIPLAELAGLNWSLSRKLYKGTRLWAYGHANALYLEKGTIAKFPLLRCCFSDYVTVTLRGLGHEAERNASPDWQRVIEEIGKERKVIVMQDDMTIEERMRLYSGAFVNIGMSTGPMALCHFSDAPYLTFKFGADPHTRKVMTSQGFGPGSQFAFRHERQSLIWEQDTFETVMSHYRQFEKLPTASGLTTPTGI